MKKVTIGNRVYMEMSRREGGEYFHKQFKHALKQSTEAHIRTGNSQHNATTYTLKGGIMEQIKKEEKQIRFL